MLGCIRYNVSNHLESVAPLFDRMVKIHKEENILDPYMEIINNADVTKVINAETVPRFITFPFLCLEYSSFFKLDHNIDILVNTFLVCSYIQIEFNHF